MSAPRYRWQPSTADIAEAAGVAVEDVIRFDHNTSPFPTDWAVDLVADGARALNEYPAADYRVIREAAARRAGLSPDEVTVGAGVDELLLLVGRAFLGPGRTAVALTPSYPLYEISSLQVGAELVEVPVVGPSFAFPVDDIVAASRSAAVTWLCVPDNPTGLRPRNESIAEIVAATPGIVVIDAAYAEFAGDDWAPWVGRHRNLIALHTLSKAFGVAAIRVGYALAAPHLIDAIDAVRPPGSISSLSVQVATAALGRADHMRCQVAAIVAERDRFATLLAGLGFRVVPSQANFLLCEAGEGAQRLADGLMGEGLVVRRYPAGSPLERYLRFTVRSPAENDKVTAALERRLG